MKIEYTQRVGNIEETLVLEYQHMDCINYEALSSLIETLKGEKKPVVPQEAGPGKWDVFEVKEQGQIIGYRVGWSRADKDGARWYIRHYLTNEKEGQPSLEWCKMAAERQAGEFNQEGRMPRSME